MTRHELSDAELDALLFASTPYEHETDRAAPSARRAPMPEATARRRAGMRAIRRGRFAWVAPAVAVAAAVVIVAGGAIMAVGLRDQPDVVGQPPSTSPSPANTATPTPILKGVIGTGQFVSDDGTASGRVEVHADGATADFVLSDLDLGGTYENVSSNLVLGSRASNRCADAGFSFGDFTGTSTTFTAPVDWVSGDWTAVAQVLIATHGVRAENDGCSNRILLRAVIEWTVESPLAYLADVSDEGARTGARGEVLTEPNGQRVYVVAPNDQLDDVAARFGLTREELFALNPGRLPSPRDVSLYIDEKLNLDLEFR